MTFDNAGSFVERVGRVVDVDEEEEATGGARGGEEEELAEEESAAFLEAAESGDGSDHLAEERVAPQPDAAAPQPNRAVTKPDAAVSQLFASVRIQRKPNGAITIEAPPEAAASLTALFSGMAQLMEAAQQPEQR